MKVSGPKAPVVIAPSPAAQATPPSIAATPVAPDSFSSSLKEIALAGTITDPKVQISGMAWHGDQLLLLPQWGSKLYALSKPDLLQAAGGGCGPLTPRELPIHPPGELKDVLPGNEGFEAMAIVGDRVYLLAEAKRSDEMFGYLLSGRITPAGVELDLNNVKELPVADQVKNMGYEALVVSGDQVIALPEATFGHHVAHAFSLDLQPLGTVAMPPVDYRLTDSTPADSDGRFWVANYHHPGDAGLPEAPRVEQLQPMRLQGGRVEKDGAPRTITPDLSQPGRNWEAVAKLDDQGFLVMTDEFPRAVFGFVTGELPRR